MSSDAENNAVSDAAKLVVELQLGQEEVTMDQSLVEDLEADSFDLMNIVAILEEDHGVAITEEAAAAVRTVGDLVALVTSLKQS